MNDERGFMPFSLAGFLILMLVLALLWHTSWSGHRLATNTIESAADESLLATAASIQSDLQHIARYAVYRALWEVCERANYYENDESRENMIERLASRYFMEYVLGVSQAYKHLDARVELEFRGMRLSFESFPSLDLFFDLLDILSAWPSFDLHQAENGYALVEVWLPKGTRIIVSSWDNYTTLALPCENFEVFIDCRYFLLQERMGKFVREFDDIRSSWKWAEYAAAWGQALAGWVNISESRSKTLFRLAWANHEFKTFGSADYPAVAMGLANLDTGALTCLTSDADIVIKPIGASDARKMICYVDDGIQALERTRAELTDVDRYIGYAEDEIQENSCALEDVRSKLGSAIASISRALEHIREVHQQFQQLLNFIASKRGNDAMMLQLYEGLTSPIGNYPSPARRVSLGVEGVENKLMELKGRIDYQVQRILSSNGSDDLGNSLSQLHSYVGTCVQGLLAEPVPKYQESYEEYPDPRAYDPEDDPSPTTRIACIYIMERNDGTIGTLDATLKDVRASLERMEDVAGDFELEQGELSGAKIDGELMQVLLGGLDSRSGQLVEFDRERLYELLPPTPIRPQPGLSVFHEFDIKDVSYRRVDPCGRLGGPSAPPTPTPLWFIGVTLYWGQWEVTLELENKPIERIFDFLNQTVPRPLLEDGGVGLARVHKSLGYRFELPRTKFSFTLLIISPRYFNVGADD
jgi:hypothetical protein